MSDFILVLNCDTRWELHSKLTSCDRKGIIWAKIALSRLAISVWKTKEEQNEMVKYETDSDFI